MKEVVPLTKWYYVNILAVFTKELGRTRRKFLDRNSLFIHSSEHFSLIRMSKYLEIDIHQVYTWYITQKKESWSNSYFDTVVLNSIFNLFIDIGKWPNILYISLNVYSAKFLNVWLFFNTIHEQVFFNGNILGFYSNANREG